MKDFRKFARDTIVLFDGGMGSYIYQKGVFLNKCYDELNISNAEFIMSIHQDYLQAGADIIETNTFGANWYKLSRHGLERKVSEINRIGVEIARKAAGDTAYVCGSVGPLGVKIEPWGETSFEEARKAFKDQISVLACAGADAVILETFQEISELEQAIIAAKQVTDIPVIAQMAVQADGKTAFGLSVEDIAERLQSSEADIAGMNCAVGPKAMLENLELMVRHCKKPISVMPNAGIARFYEGRTMYMTTPDYFGVYARRFIDAGASIVGGCCGTTPEHIKNMAEALRQKTAQQERRVIQVQKHTKSGKSVKPVEPEKKSGFARKLYAGNFVTLVEMVAPRGNDISRQIKGANLLKERGIDVINIPDGPRASARMNGMALAANVQKESGIETLLHYTCRDRNILGMQSDLIGAASLGINNILAVTGDPPMVGDYPDATAVFDIDSIGLTHLLSNLNAGVDISGKSIGHPTKFLIGVGADPNSINPEREIKRMWWKVDAGAEFVITQPVFDIETLRKFAESIQDFNIKIIAGIWPLVSLRNAEFMKNEVPGVFVPDDVMNTMRSYAAADDQFKAGIDIAVNMVEKVKPLVHGIQVSAPFGKYSVAADVAKPVLNT